jgi:hypothetical protein
MSIGRFLEELKKWGAKALTGFNWLRTGTSGDAL